MVDIQLCPLRYNPSTFFNIVLCRSHQLTPGNSIARELGGLANCTVLLQASTGYKRAVNRATKAGRLMTVLIMKRTAHSAVSFMASGIFFWLRLVILLLTSLAGFWPEFVLLSTCTEQNGLYMAAVLGLLVTCLLPVMNYYVHVRKSLTAVSGCN
jgi:hypothetical protein